MRQATVGAMDALEIAAFLETQATGVLAMAADGAVYAAPVAVVYIDEGPAFYFRADSGPDGQLTAFIDRCDGARFVTYDRTDEGWKTVIAEGRVERRSESALDAAVELAVERLQLPDGPFRTAAEAPDVTVGRLVVDKLSGHVTPLRGGQGD